MPSRQECANAIRILTVDAIEKAGSGHPGMPMGMADIAEVLWRDFLKFNPSNPNWINRDRFILSNGHGAMLQYALLHLTGFDVTIEDLKNFRQFRSRTPGHPEFKNTPGVETTTGPLGQGLANGVGMAIAEQIMASTFNRKHFSIINHYTYVFISDGDLMEGISHEACSLAGTLGLGKLIVFYDDNGISIDGDVNGWFTDNTEKRFKAYKWQVIPCIDGHNSNTISQAITVAKSELTKPTLICCKTIIGYGAPTLSGKAIIHGTPLGTEEVYGVRKILRWPYPPFKIPKEIYAAWDAKKRGKEHEVQWNQLFAHYKKNYPELGKELLRRKKKMLPEAYVEAMEQYILNEEKLKRNDATRKLSLKCLNAISPFLPELIGGSADLSESNCTKWLNATVFSKENRKGNYIEYGVREFAMTAIVNGISLYGGFIPFAGTFLTFSDYSRNAVRLAALNQTHAIFIYSHDSIGVGEDGPTHQPIEQLPALRMIPNLYIWRPCDGIETAVAWKEMIAHHRPSCLLLTRQKVIHQHHDAKQMKLMAKGGYVLWEAKEEPAQVILIATGSEVMLAVEAAMTLESNIPVRVISMPCCEIFKKQSIKYQESVLPECITKRIAIEAAYPDYWYQFVGRKGKVIGIDRFGTSASYKVLYREYGFTLKRVIDTIKWVFKKNKREEK
ncbi:transketolase [Coxiella endosymbiont of Amblyomma americanum]|uniref:transketolase n=1 Tax=Coxiella endosymbiont of Amblyomma americanum TaxID=325775 RepID=UPI0005801FAB|nr:transketolase [Coxiella endosymbiont of Amblyomma americanum]AJC50185.1 transketolase [Coxiella endosymbiont of Amblyomma americanum]AUJ58546.1 transketolase [Coxiella-like endosymbiont of Amblyomma americanum]